MSELPNRWAIEPDERHNPAVPAPGRRYDYLLGGKDNYASDRASGDAIAEVFPGIIPALAANRRFVLRATRFLAADAGIRQFLDIGCGLPTAENVHQVAQGVHPDARIVYADNDPLIMAHARALLTGNGMGPVGYAEADLRDPAELLKDPAVRGTLNLGQPVGVLLCAVLHFLTDDAEARSVVRQLVDALPSGSYVVISHATYDPLPGDVAEKLEAMAQDLAHGPFRARSRAHVEAFVDGLELIHPGIVSTADWQPDPDVPEITAAEAASWAAVARIP